MYTCHFFLLITVSTVTSIVFIFSNQPSYFYKNVIVGNKCACVCGCKNLIDYKLYLNKRLIKLFMSHLFTIMLSECSLYVLCGDVKLFCVREYRFIPTICMVSSQCLEAK